MRLILLLVFSLAPLTSWAGITFHGTTGQTLYARVQIGASTFESVQLTEGTSGGLGVYSVADAALVSAGVNVAGTHPFTIRSGTASDTANDAIRGEGELPWSGAVELPAFANITYISGDATAADNAEAAFDGTGYNVGAGRIMVKNGTFPAQ